MFPEVNPSLTPTLEQYAVKLTDPITSGPADVIDGLLPNGQLVIAGETEAGKTLCSMEIASSLLTGIPLWGELKPNLKAKKVVHFLAEHQVEVLQRLAIKTGLNYGNDYYVLDPDRLGYDRWLVQQGRPNLASIDKFKKWATGCDLVIFDPLSAFVSGVDENDNIAMRLVLQTMSDIAHQVGASSIVLAHQGKPVFDYKGQEHTRKAYAIRGASAIEDCGTNIFYLSKTDQKPTGQILELNKRKYKGHAPDQYKLLRDSRTLTHTLLLGKTDGDILKMDAKSKLGAMLVAFPRYERDIVIRITATALGLSEETFRRRINEPA